MRGKNFCDNYFYILESDTILFAINVLIFLIQVGLENWNYLSKYFYGNQVYIALVSALIFSSFIFAGEVAHQ